MRILNTKTFLLETEFIMDSVGYVIADFPMFISFDTSLFSRSVQIAEARKGEVLDLEEGGCLMPGWVEGEETLLLMIVT